MSNDRFQIFSVVALIMGAAGLGFGTYSIINFQLVEGTPGPPGADGKDAPGGLIIAILDPDPNEIISGNVTIKALIYGSNNYNILIFLNTTTELGTTLPSR